VAGHRSMGAFAGRPAIVFEGENQVPQAVCEPVRGFIRLQRTPSADIKEAEGQRAGGGPQGDGSDGNLTAASLFQSFPQLAPLTAAPPSWATDQTFDDSQRPREDTERYDPDVLPPPPSTRRS